MNRTKWALGGKLAVVTGGAGILGSEICKKLAGGGANVICADKNGKKAARLTSTLFAASRQSHFALELDVSQPTSIRGLLKKIKKRFKAVPSILINAAATKTRSFKKYFQPFEKYELSTWNKVLDVNLTGTMLCCQYIGSEMVRAGGGSIINFSSIYGVVAPDSRLYKGSQYADQGGAFNSPVVYTTTKTAIIGLTRYLAAYWGSKNVRVNAISPGGVASGQNRVFTRKYASKTPRGRMAKASEIADAVLYLSSDDSCYVNGHNLVIDGGYSIW